jgi:putative nucleotidyltransferase with HDIG domain
LGVKEIIWVPEKSEKLPLSPDQKSDSPSLQVVSDAPDEEMKILIEAKIDRIQQLKRRRENVAKCEKRFQSGVKTVKNVMRTIHSGSAESVAEADELLHDLVDALSFDKEATMQLVNAGQETQNVSYHSLNVSVLSMMLGRAYGLDPGQLRLLGLGALFHDVGKNQVPKNIITKTGPLTQSETNFLQLHPKYGEAIVSKVGAFPIESADIVLHHHERCDGKGYPDKLTKNQIPVLTRIAAIANTYDNYCNSLDPRDSLTPHEALSRMFASEGEAFDKNLVALFIKCLGVYAPGTIVKLSNGLIGLVISVNRNDLLKPTLVVYDPEVPKEEALIFDLSDETSLSIEHSIRPFHLDPEVFDYLSPRTRISYYVADSDSFVPPFKPGQDLSKH